MSKTIDDTDVSFLGDYVASLPVVDDKIAATGDSAKGKSLYTTCAACHGPEGAGMEALKAPPIANLEAWYIESQLTKFRKGIRGAHPKDTTGAQMAPMAKSLADDQAVTDVAAYITTL
ncbi:MAG: c-type cytochrome [Alphaproteobacteria bacterium]|nr:c-type cytochrome [Alphaproteobacteria bacterium]